MAKLEQREILQLKWLSGGLLYIFALWAVAPVDGLGGIAAISCAAAALPFLARARLTLQLRRRAWNLVGGAILLLVAADFLLSSGDIISPLVRMIMLLGLLRCIQARQRREDLQLVLISLFMVVLGGALTNSLLFGVQLLIFAPGAMLVLFLIQAGESIAKEDHKGALAQDYKPTSLLVRALRSLNWRLLLLWAGLYCCLLAATGLIFVSMPRFRLDRALPFLKPPAHSSLSGFSDNIEFGEITEIALDDSVAMRADVAGELPGPIPFPYWRMAVLDEYHGVGFRESRSAAESKRLLRQAELALNEHPLTTGGVTWTIYLEGGISRYLPMPGKSDLIRFQGEQDITANAATRALTTRDTPGSLFFYQLQNVQLERTISATPLDSSLTGPRKFSRDQAPNDYPFTTLALPLEETDRRALEVHVQEIRAGRDLDAQAFGQATVNWLSQRKRYSLHSQLPPGRNDVVVRWLASDAPGHCELFAGSFTLLMRAAGFPTRVVTGYAGGTWNGFENYFMISNSSAHAWAEVFDGKQWMRFDPTPGAEALAGAGDATLVQVDRTIPAYLDSLRILWYRRIVNFDHAQQVALLGGIKDGLENLSSVMRARLKGLAQRLENWASAPLSRNNLQHLLYNIALVSGIWLCIRLLLSRKRRRRDQAASDAPSLHPIRRRAGALLSKFQHTRLTMDDVREQLELLRYGPSQHWPDQPRVVLRKARMRLRKGS